MEEQEYRLSEILRHLQELQLSIEGVRGSMQHALRSSEDHEDRLRKVERWQNQMSPLLALGTFVGGVLFQVVMTRWMA
ncbi:MAG: hypothetical protein KDA68_17725 [Planctomycetaceae bacterium]|nr:hypothetical protein [Planctomycetaceae bacterium]MCA9097780.1 hypothetical protein [Planctomycetaceae bacterium]